MLSPRFIAAILGALSLGVAGCQNASKPARTAEAPPLPPDVLQGAPLGAEVHDIAHVDEKPRPRFQARPHFPADLRAAGVSGEAVVDFVVGPDGRVRGARSIRETHPAFGHAAVESVSQWVFTPGKKHGRVVWTHMQVPIVFSSR